MRKYLIKIVIFLGMSTACENPVNVDAIFYNGIIYTVDQQSSVVEAIAINKGKIIATGNSNTLLNKYNPDKKIDLAGNYVYPGFYDAHCHFLGYGLSLRHADLTGTTSFESVLDRLTKHAGHHQSEWLLGRGWDQNDWDEKTFPTRHMLDARFPDIPVYITRIDGHAAVANSMALKLAEVTSASMIDGGEVMLDKQGEPNGVLIDNAMQFVEKVLPGVDKQVKKEALLEAQSKCFAVGLTSVADAGLSVDEIRLIESLQKDSLLQMRIYAMLNPTPENLEQFIQKGRIQTPSLSISSIKLYADGALGSRGARLIEPYADDPGNQGLLIESETYYRKWCGIALDNGYQVNTHCIGDGANRFILDIYGDVLKDKNDKRWRIEHAQIIHPDDIQKFAKFSVIPSIQPTHATSDMYWADERLGSERLKTAYMYQSLLKQNGWLPAGSDFPVESINPLLGFYAAVARKDIMDFPEDGFQSEEALTREQALRAMTIWAARAGFEEHIKGSLEPGKVADFVVLAEDLMTIDVLRIPELKVRETYLDGIKVY